MKIEANGEEKITVTLSHEDMHRLDITYDEIYTRGLKVMDLTATTMCKENNLPIIVFNMDKNGNLKKVMDGEDIGTYVHN